MSKARLATVWLDGCSGCHMSFLDMDERLIEVLQTGGPRLQPLGRYEGISGRMCDVVLVEGAVSSEDDLEKILKIRKRTKILVSLGDCAVTSNVPSMRNRFKLEEVEHRAYVENAQCNQGVPRTVVPKLLPPLPPGA